MPRVSQDLSGCDCGLLHPLRHSHRPEDRSNYDLGAFRPPGHSQGEIMRLFWTANWQTIGNGYGYSTHQRMLKAALEAQGVAMADDAPVAIHIVVPPGFQPVFAKYNVLYTMYEGETIPEEWIPPLQFPDLIVVPCTHNVHVFQKYTDRPVVHCPEGVDVDKFTFYQRKKPFPGLEDFTFLWIGASNPRKGYEHVAVAWRIFKDRYPAEFERSILILKTTQTTKAERLISSSPNRFFVDTRNYNIENLVTLYHSAHCFLFPSMGEGFGLTLAEAMCTGLPCIYTPWSGPKDFISEREGYPLRFSMTDVKTVKREDDGSLSDYHTTCAVSADPNHIARRMAQVYSDYDEALRRGKRAADRIRRDFTWAQSAQKFMAIIEKYTGIKERVA